MREFLSSVLAVLAFLLPISANAGQIGIVTFTVDNADSDFFDKRMPIFFAHNVPGTLFAHSKRITREARDIHWEDIRTLISNGWEFGAHGYSHRVLLSEASDETLDLELGAPAAQVFRETGIYPTTFASPYGDFNDEVLERISLYYDAHVRAWGNEGVNHFDSTDYFRINRKQVVQSRTSVEVCAEIEGAGHDGYWLVLMWHYVADLPTSRYENSIEQFEGAVKCAADMRDNGIVRLMTVKEALQHIPHTPE